MPSDAATRIAKNTTALYIRMLLSMIISLYTSRITLNILGIEDYGIYNIVGGVVALFSVINASMTSSVQRFTAYELGLNNTQRINIVFNISSAIHNSLAVGFGIFSTIIGLWFIYHQLNIPPDRLTAAVWVLISAILCSMMYIIQVPYNASIIAHEHMTIYAYTGILDTVLKLVIVLMLTMFPYDKLIIYSLLLCIATAIPMCITIGYCRRKFEECHFRKIFDKKLFKQMTGFAGWSFFSSTAATGYSQGTNIILNIFLGVTINAARGIAFQVSTAITRFARNFQIALNPQIIKAYATNNLPYMHTLIFRGTKISFLLMLILSLPILVCTNYILTLWLKTVPAYTTIFCQLVLIEALISCISNTLIVAAEASGHIGKFQCWSGIISLCNLPITYLLLHYGYSPQSTLYAAIFLQCVALFMRIYFLRSLIKLSIRVFCQKVLIRLFSITIVAIGITILFRMQFEAINFMTLIAIGCISTISIAIGAYILGFDNTERKIIKQYCCQFFTKKLKKH